MSAAWCHLCCLVQTGTLHLCLCSFSIFQLPLEYPQECSDNFQGSNGQCGSLCFSAVDHPHALIFISFITFFFLKKNQSLLSFAIQTTNRQNFTVHLPDSFQIQVNPKSLRHSCCLIHIIHYYIFQMHDLHSEAVLCFFCWINKLHLCTKKLVCHSWM